MLNLPVQASKETTLTALGSFFFCFCFVILSIVKHCDIKIRIYKADKCVHMYVERKITPLLSL